MYRPVAVIAPGAAIGTKAVQLLSGVVVLPVRMLIATLVPAGVTLFQVRVLHVTDYIASKTRDWNVPVAAYGDMRIQSTSTLPPKTLKSLAAIGRNGPPTLTG